MSNEVKELFENNYALLCLVSFSIVRDREIAKDLVQDFFVSFWSRRDTVSITSSFEAYARQSVKNLSFQHLEKVGRQRRLQKELDAPREDYQPPMEEPSKNGKLKALLEQMPDKRREIFVSFVVHGKSYAEIAESKGVSINTVKTQMKRAYAFLRNQERRDFLYLFLTLASGL